MMPARAFLQLLLCAAFPALACLSAPTAEDPVCGDGELDDDEECDDGNDLDTDGCLASCVVARCGDGVIRRDVETCDSLDASLDCTIGCLACPADEFHLHGENSGNCYARTDDPLLNWSDAGEACADAGGHLMTQATPDERSMMAEWPDWIGLSDLRVEGNWEWVTGERFRDASWAPGEPTDGNEHCVFQGGDDLWNNLDCSIAQPYACENEAWLVRPDDGHAYRIGDDTLPWTDARDACSELGGHLLVLETREEEAFLAGRFPSELWIGASFHPELGEYGWGPAQPFDFTSWGVNNPDEGQPCVNRDEDGLWDSSACENQLGWLCEIDG